MKMGTAGGDRGEGREVGWWGGGDGCASSGAYADRVQFISVQDGISALGKAHMRSSASLRRFPALPCKQRLG